MPRTCQIMDCKKMVKNITDRFCSPAHRELDKAEAKRVKRAHAKLTPTPEEIEKAKRLLRYHHGRGNYICNCPNCPRCVAAKAKAAA